MYIVLLFDKVFGKMESDTGGSEGAPSKTLQARIDHWKDLHDRGEDPDGIFLSVYATSAQKREAEEKSLGEIVTQEEVDRMGLDLDPQYTYRWNPQPLPSTQKRPKNKKRSLSRRAQLYAASGKSLCKHFFSCILSLHFGGNPQPYTCISNYISVSSRQRLNRD